MKILVADDDLTSRELLRAILTKDGHEVFQACNGREAWAAMDSDDAPVLAVLDWMMPEMDGIEVLRRVRARETKCRPYVLLLTSKNEKSEVIAGLEAGADDYLTKPVHPGELRARIDAGKRLVELQEDLVTAKESLAHEASHDPLTGVLNRRSIESRLSSEVSRVRRYRTKLAVGIFDIDHFKAVNDTYGHAVGDDVLRGLTALLQKNLRDCDLLGRWGGEEFVVLAPGISGAGVRQAFEKLRVVTERTPVETENGPIRITISIGVACAAGEDGLESLLKRADDNLYEAKNGGRNRVVTEEPGEHCAARRT